jgi:cell division septal protein FtsQ
MSGVLRVLAVIACAAALLLSAAFAPLALRGLDGFAVRRIEVVGSYHLTAEAAVAASGIDGRSNVFDDPNPWLASLTQHPLVANARIERRVPGTIVLHVREAVPVAFARTPELRAIDERARVLPANPAADDMDLPVLTFASKIDAAGRAADPSTQRVATFLGIVEREAPALLGWISEVGTHGTDVRLTLRNAPTVDVLLPAEPSLQQLSALSGIMAELMSEITTVRRIDVRFHDQVVVALHGRKN